MPFLIRQLQSSLLARRFVQFLLFCSLSVAPAYGEPDIAIHSALPTLKINVNLVTLNFSVKSPAQTHLSDLKKEDILLLEDGVPQDVTHFSSDPIPLNLVVLLDVSDSTKPYSKDVATAVQVLSTALSFEDEAAVIAFSNFPSLLQEFTHAQREIFFALENGRRRIAGATNINDSIYLAAKKLNTVKGDRRRVILLLSDGQGNRGERERAFSELRSSGASLLWVTFGMTARLFRGVAQLSQWVKQTGGFLLNFEDKRRFKEELRDALGQVRNRYSVGYVSTNQDQDGGFRRLELRIAPTSTLAAKNLKIEAPVGYFALPKNDLAYEVKALTP